MAAVFTTAVDSSATRFVTCAELTPRQDEHRHVGRGGDRADRYEDRELAEDACGRVGETAGQRLPADTGSQIGDRQASGGPAAQQADDATQVGARRPVTVIRSE